MNPVGVPLRSTGHASVLQAPLLYELKKSSQYLNHANSDLLAAGRSRWRGSSALIAIRPVVKRVVRHGAAIQYYAIGVALQVIHGTLDRHLNCAMTAR